MNDQGDIRDRIIDASVAATIVDAATARIIYYGFGKTSMADIASDCYMSPGNLYRYFVNKMGIAEAVAQRSYEVIFLFVRDAASTLGMTARERLEAYCMAILRSTFDQMALAPHMVEFANLLNTKRPALDREAHSAMRGVLADILDQGVANGEFDLADIPAAALAIQAVTFKFWYPQTHGHDSYDVLERELREVLSMVFKGLLSR